MTRASTVFVEVNTAHVIGFMPPRIRRAPRPAPLMTRVEDGRNAASTSSIRSRPRAPAEDELQARGTTRSCRRSRTAPTAQAFNRDRRATTSSTWGGLPFIEYNSAIRGSTVRSPRGRARTEHRASGYLRRGDVSGGCNRMLGENVVELAHVLASACARCTAGTSRIPSPPPRRSRSSTGYDTLDGKLIDSDYATDVGVTRPSKVVGGQTRSSCSARGGRVRDAERQGFSRPT